MLVLWSATAPDSAAARSGATAQYVSGLVPIVGHHKTLSAVRPAGLSPKSFVLTARGKPTNGWTKLTTLSGAVVHDVAFSSPTTGYAAAELGQVWKTTDGGAHWSKVLNRNFPYYYYGVSVSGENVTVSGFNNSTAEAILSESDDGGTTWNEDTILSDGAWAGRVRFSKGLAHGLAMNGSGLAGTNPNIAWWTRKPGNWKTVVPDPDGGWFGNQFTLLKHGDAFASGITYCKGTGIGAVWSCTPPADPIFDGPTEFINDRIGWTGGGEISPDVAGWVHRTTDGGATWSGRVLETPWPVRQITFLNKKVGWAAGGNVYSGVGGIYFSSNGGKTWTQDADTGDEMDACDSQPIGDGSQTQVWCIGFLFNGSSFASDVYTTTVATP
jgi:photosystem II stability/assembly factor-like uncharacterized protein